MYDDDHDYDLRKAGRKWREEEEKKEDEARMNADYDFRSFWKAINKDFGLGMYAPDVVEKRGNWRRRKEEPQAAGKQN